VGRLAFARTVYQFWVRITVKRVLVWSSPCVYYYPPPLSFCFSPCKIILFSAARLPDYNRVFELAGFILSYEFRSPAASLHTCSANALSLSESRFGGDASLGYPSEISDYLHCQPERLLMAHTLNFSVATNKIH
jgi:hypothetical protein